MTMSYNVVGEVSVAPTAKRAAGWMDALAEYSPAVSRTSRGASELVITLPARSLEQAVSTGLAVLLRAAGELERFEVLTTDEYDRRADDVAMPELVGASEAARIIGITRQRVQQLVELGRLPAVKVGTSLVLQRGPVEAVARARAEDNRVDG